ncbi:hypothetical protein CoNPh17_CDS0094 [Staphylococcus phage S-CoN_Ph17]|nr:hypothetical protein CoNPh17_CDS0094 [Staphylococcus phage S-CoN_Ph17]
MLQKKTSSNTPINHRNFMFFIMQQSIISKMQLQH